MQNQYFTKAQKPKTAIIIGAGIAGCAIAFALAKRGIRVKIVEKNNKIANEASGNIIGVAYPRLTAKSSDFGDFYKQSFLYAKNILQEIGDKTSFKQSGCLMLNYNLKIKKRNIDIFKNTGWDNSSVKLLNKKQAEDIAGVALNCGGIFYPYAGYLSPPKLCQALLDMYVDMIDVEFKCKINSIDRNGQKQKWQVGKFEADMVVIASGREIANFEQTKWLCKYLQFIAGQVSHIKANKYSQNLRTVIAHDGYISPAVENIHYAGATFHRLDNSTDFTNIIETMVDNTENISKIAQNLPALNINKNTIDMNLVGARAQIRVSTKDHLPVIGRVPKLVNWKVEYGDLKYGKILEKDINFKYSSYFSNLYLIGGLGSHGMTSALLAGEIIASDACCEASPVLNKTLRAVNVGRYIVRAIKRGEVI